MTETDTTPPAINADAGGDDMDESSSSKNTNNASQNELASHSKEVPNNNSVIRTSSETNDRTAETSQSDEKDAGDIASSDDQTSEDKHETGVSEAASGEGEATAEQTVAAEDIESHLLPVTDETLEHLTEGFLQAFVPHIETSYESLDELMRNQRVLIETVQQENVKCNENDLVTELAEVMTEARIYHSKLVNVKKEMTSLHERTTKLKKRALKLQQQKMKENLAKEQQREKEMEQERHLIAKPISKRTEQANAAKKSEQGASAAVSDKELPNKAI
ncbi:uncharacterized protein [Amphiura filiformis]|uniref:uncharacterized protein n=1 Tax=Amphiura filiformis TaxID=82378 RepID=UPI003B218213